MTGLSRYEWRRLRSLPGNRALLAAVVGFALLADLTAAGKPLDAEGVVFHVVQRDLAVRWLAATAVGAQAFGHEFRYGTIRPTLLGFPRRHRLLAGKAAAAALAGTAGALLASAASLALLLVLTRWDRSLFADPRLWRSLAFGAVMVGLVAAMAAGLGALTRGTGLPVVLLALWAGIVEPLVAAVLGGGAGLLPFLSMLQLAAYSGEAVDLGAASPRSPLVFPSCLAAVLVAAGVVVARRDAATPLTCGYSAVGGPAYAPARTRNARSLHMAKLIYSAIASLDGYVADKDGNFDWAEPDEEVHRFVNDLERPVGTYLYGRRMYETMVYWETANAQAGQRPVSRDYTEIWQSADKVVYSRTLEATSSVRTRIERDFDPEAVRQLKAAAGADLSVGGPGLAAEALKAGLVDECHLFLSPVVVGGGNRAFGDDVRLRLELADERRFGNGVVHLHYRITP